MEETKLINKVRKLISEDKVILAFDHVLSLHENEELEKFKRDYKWIKKKYNLNVVSYEEYRLLKDLYLRKLFELTKEIEEINH